MLQMTVLVSITFVFGAVICFVRLLQTDVNPLFHQQSDKRMEWRCHSCRQWRFGIDGLAKALQLPASVRALQIENLEEIVCKEHVYQCCRMQHCEKTWVDEKKAESE